MQSSEEKTEHITLPIAPRASFIVTKVVDLLPTYPLSLAVCPLPLVRSVKARWRRRTCPTRPTCAVAHYTRGLMYRVQPCLFLLVRSLLQRVLSLSSGASKLAGGAARAPRGRRALRTLYTRPYVPRVTVPVLTSYIMYAPLYTASLVLTLYIMYTQWVYAGF